MGRVAARLPPARGCPRLPDMSAPLRVNPGELLRRRGGGGSVRRRGGRPSGRRCRSLLDAEEEGHSRPHEITRDHSRPHEITRDHSRSLEITRDHSRSHEITRDHSRSHEIARDRTRSHEITPGGDTCTRLYSHGVAWARPLCPREPSAPQHWWCLVFPPSLASSSHKNTTPDPRRTSSDSRERDRQDAQAQTPCLHTPGGGRRSVSPVL